MTEPVSAALAKRQILFEPFTSRNLSLPSRFVMSPMGRGNAPAGVPATGYGDYYRRRVEGGVGLVLTGATAISHELADYDGSGPLFHGEAPLGAWRSILAAVHAAGGKLMPQLWHTGMERRTASFGDARAIGPSGISIADLDAGRAASGKPMDDADMADVIDAYAMGAAAARDIGFDGIEVHAGHGFLLDQFLWHRTNRRTDRYGAIPEDRGRFPAEVVAACRHVVGPDFPILLRMSQFKIDAYDARIAEDPATLAALLRPLVDAGVDIFHCSQRQAWDAEFAGNPLNLAGWVKSLTGRPTISVGSVGVGSAFTEEEAANPTQTIAAPTLDHLDLICDMMARGDFDLLAVGRSLLADAAWPRKVREGRDADLNPFTPDAMMALT